MMKRVLLLSCSTGQGHNSCAEAVKEYFEEQHVVCEIYDSLKFIGEKFARFMSWGHSFMYRHIPGLFRWGYRYSEDHPNAVSYTHLDVYKRQARGTGLHIHVGEIHLSAERGA